MPHRFEVDLAPADPRARDDWRSRPARRRCLADTTPPQSLGESRRSNGLRPGLAPSELALAVLPCSRSNSGSPAFGRSSACPTPVTRLAFRRSRFGGRAQISGRMPHDARQTREWRSRALILRQPQWRVTRGASVRSLSGGRLSSAAYLPREHRRGMAESEGCECQSLRIGARSTRRE
jgi:hypothetical protein